MTNDGGAPLSVALLRHGSPGDGPLRELVRALGEAGVRAELVSPATEPLAELLLGRRGFAAGLTSVPAGVVALRRRDVDLAHAFSAPDAVTALAWRRLVGRPVVFTCPEPLSRDRLADRRLRLWMLERAVRDPDAVCAAGEDVRASLQRWLAVDAPVLDPRDAAGHERLYRELVARGREPVPG